MSGSSPSFVSWSEPVSDKPDVQPVRDYLMSLQDEICAAFEEADGSAVFQRDELAGERGGLSRPRVLEGGDLLERAGVMFSHTKGPEMPKAATVRRPELAGRRFEAVSVSLITHPRNPYVPTSHMNVRVFIAEKDGEEPVWWFGGGFDLTPYYGFDDDCAHWHRTARDALAPSGDGVYERMKTWCDEYFVLHHRKEPRGIGGVFFDDWQEGGFDACFATMRAVGDAYLRAYLPIVERRRETPYGDRERDWQTWRRGRYVEFNLVWDRGTLFGLQAGARAESLLASMPPVVTWRYDHHPEPGTPEAALFDRYLVPRDWAALAPS